MDTEAILLAIKTASEENSKAISASEERLTGLINGISHKLLAVEERVATVEGRVDTNAKKIESLTAFKNAYQDTLIDMQNKTVMTEYHGKKFNLICFGIEQTKDWETRKELMAALKTFLTIINIDMDTITVTAIHRLQTVKGTKPLPLIFKLQNLDDCYKILDGENFKKLKAYNTANEAKLGITRQLPARMQQDIKQLKAKYKKAQADKLKPKMKLDSKTACMYLQIGSENIYPKHSILGDSRALDISPNAW